MKSHGAPAKAGAQCSSSRKQKALGSGFRRSALTLSLLLTACTSTELPASSAPPLDLLAFFEGETRGDGVLNPIIGRSVPISVESRGTREGKGLRLVQRITEGEKPTRTRTWIMVPAGPNRFTGTLTDARGPVAITVEGPRATLSYRTPSGMRIRQELTLQEDGEFLFNQLSAYRFGIRVAVLNEVIRR